MSSVKETTTAPSTDFGQFVPVLAVAGVLVPLILILLCYKYCYSSGHEHARARTMRTKVGSLPVHLKTKEEHEGQVKNGPVSGAMSASVAPGAKVLGLAETGKGVYKTQVVHIPRISLGANAERRRSLALLAKEAPHSMSVLLETSPQERNKVDSGGKKPAKPTSSHRTSSSDVLNFAYPRETTSSAMSSNHYARLMEKHGFRFVSMKASSELERHTFGPVPVFAYSDSLDMFSRYEMPATEIAVIRKLGAGAFADVHLCTFRGRECAVKVIRKDNGFVG